MHPQHVLTSTALIAEDRPASIMPAASINAATIANGGKVQECVSLVQAAIEGGTVTPTYTVAGDLNMKSVLISVSELVSLLVHPGLCRDHMIFLNNTF